MYEPKNLHLKSERPFLAASGTRRRASTRLSSNFHVLCYLTTARAARVRQLHANCLQTRHSFTGIYFTDPLRDPVRRSAARVGCM